MKWPIAKENKALNQHALGDYLKAFKFWIRQLEILSDMAVGAPEKRVNQQSLKVIKAFELQNKLGEDIIEILQGVTE